MNERRRRFIKTAGIALLPAVAGCSEQSDGGADGQTDDESESTPESTTMTTPRETETLTGTQSDVGTATPTETEVSGYGADTPTGTRTATPTETTPTEEVTSTATPGSTDAVALVIDSVGVRAWEVVEDESGSAAPTSENNPTLTFDVGRRYAVENRGWSTHPFAIRDADDTALLSQSADGSYEGDDAVDWTDDGETFAFTFTEDLASAADYYICTVHSGMRGGVETA